MSKNQQPKIKNPLAKKREEAPKEMIWCKDVTRPDRDWRQFSRERLEANKLAAQNHINTPIFRERDLRWQPVSQAELDAAMGIKPMETPIEALSEAIKAETEKVRKKREKKIEAEAETENEEFPLIETN